jgi:hypothetical protein
MHFIYCQSTLLIEQQSQHEKCGRRLPSKGNN